ncbi:hypothetical protein B0H11DRAFT_1904623 [Mycena galericulata]|nr:hypothetical protein B0H11DRAFT_1904623 [Mycena galericulata]
MSTPVATPAIPITAASTAVNMAPRAWKINTGLKWFRRINATTICMTDDDNVNLKNSFPAQMWRDILEHDRILREGQFTPLAPPVGYEIIASVYNAEKVESKLALVLTDKEGKTSVDVKGPSPGIADFEVELTDIYPPDVLVKLMGDGSRIYNAQEVAWINTMLMTNAMRNDAYEQRQLKKTAEKVTTEPAAKKELSEEDKEAKVKALHFAKKRAAEDREPPTRPRYTDRRDYRDYRDQRDYQHNRSQGYYGRDRGRERSPDDRNRRRRSPSCGQPTASGSNSSHDVRDSKVEPAAAPMEVDEEDKKN